MDPRNIDADASLAAPFYAFAMLLMVTPIMDLLTSISSWQFSSVQWRFATAGLTSGFLMTPMLGIALAVGVAAVRGHYVTQRFLAVLNLLLTLALVCILAGFVLDVLQLNGFIPEEGLPAFQMAAFKAMFKYATAIVVLGMMTFGGWRISSWSSPRGTA